MRDHKLRLDLEASGLVAFCECGEWRAERSFRDGRFPSEIMVELEQEYARHRSDSPWSEREVRPSLPEKGAGHVGRT